MQHSPTTLAGLLLAGAVTAAVPQTAVPAPKHAPSNPLPAGCASSVLDQATLGCLGASSVPTLGELFPMSPELNVAAGTGFVGMGTTNPLSKLHVVASSGVALRATGTTGAALLTTSGASGPTLDVRSNGAQAAFLDGALDLGYVLSVPFQIPVTRIRAAVESGAGVLRVRNGSDVETAVLDGAGGVFDDYGSLALSNESGVFGFHATGGVIGGSLNMFTSAGLPTIQIEAADVPGEGARIALLDSTGQQTIVLDADLNGDGRITTQVLEITGGSDLAESFETGGEACEPGSVLVIDAERPGELALSTKPYDRRVAGVVSGAGGVRAGLHLGQRQVLDGSTPVALTGRVFVRCTDENGPIEPGDLLTSSSIPGHAMRASDPERAFGAVLGKALGSLEGERGLVLSLVGLQ